jgi:hypothetical protein
VLLARFFPGQIAGRAHPQQDLFRGVIVAWIKAALGG